MSAKIIWPGTAIAATLLAMSPMASLAEAAETRAAQIRNVSEDMRADESQARALFARIEILNPLNQERRKSYPDLGARLRELQSRVETANARWLDHRGARADQAKHAEAQARRCAGAARGEAYRLCAREKDEIAAKRAGLDRMTERIDSERQAAESALAAAFEEHAALAALLGASIEEQELAQKDYAQLYQRAQAFRKRLADLCTASETAREAAAISACADLGWDGRNKVFARLPSLPRLMKRSKKDN